MPAGLTNPNNLLLLMVVGAILVLVLRERGKMLKDWRHIFAAGVIPLVGGPGLLIVYYLAAPTGTSRLAVILGTGAYLAMGGTFCNEALKKRPLWWSNGQK